MLSSEVQDCLKEETTVERLEEENVSMLGTPFGRDADLWKKLKDQVQHGDKLHNFRTNRASWFTCSGRAGVALVRDGEIIYFFCTVIS